MKYAGIDIGSRSIELVIVRDGTVLEMRTADTGFNPVQEAETIIKDMEFSSIMATGYGRNLFSASFEAPTVTEIKAHARGASHVYPQSTAILDVGGQDSKVIRLNDKGKVIRFEMNDRCAAGTGKFLEIMAKSLGFSIEEFGREALRAKRCLEINSMCTVFAESEVTSLIARGESRNDISLGLHNSVVKRSVSMLRRISAGPDIVFSGGVANNPCIVNLLKDQTECEILVPEYPHMTGALGAALLAEENGRQKND